MDNYITELAKYGIFGVVFGLIVLIGFYFIIPYWLSRKMEEFKTELKKDAIEYEVRFGRFHERRVEIIDELYGKLFEAQRSFSALTSMIQSIPEGKDFDQNERDNLDIAYRAWIDSRRYLAVATLYLPWAEDMLDKVDKCFVSAWADYRTKLAVEKRSVEHGLRFSEAAREKVDNLIAPLLNQLKAQFQEILDPDLGHKIPVRY